MEKYTFSRSELILAFQKWNRNYLANPEEFDEITKDSAEKQADTLIEYLVKK